MPDATLNVVLQPRASRTEVVGWHDGRIKIRVAAPPVDGEANEELIRFLAKKLSVAKSRIVIVRGEKNKAKDVKVLDLNQEKAEELLL